jgi:hypothetical protein
MSGPWQCLRFPPLGDEGAPTENSWAMSAALRSHCRRTSHRRPFSGPFPARRLTDRPPPLVWACGEGSGTLGTSHSMTKKVVHDEWKD